MNSPAPRFGRRRFLGVAAGTLSLGAAGGLGAWLVRDDDVAPPSSPPRPDVPGRDPWLRPFTETSIWNMPIGSGARYVPAGIPLAAHIELDQLILEALSADDPERPLMRPGSWQHRCSGTDDTGVRLPLPDDWLVPDATRRPDGSYHTPNHGAAFLLPDGRTVEYSGAIARCERGGPVYGYRTGRPAFDTGDVYGDGRLGGHGGSRLSTLGGAIRVGELDPSADPIPHALDLVLWAKHFHFDAAGIGYRWPAESADSYASRERYQGPNPELRMGSLLALPPATRLVDLGVTTAVGRKLFRAMQDHGGYITDDSAWDTHMLSVERAAVGTFPWGDAEQADFNRIVAATHVVANNGPDSVGGGGEPRRTLLPPLRPPD